MARHESSVDRLTLRFRAPQHAHRTSVGVVFVRQTGTIQGQLESSTELTTNGLCRWAGE